MRTIEQNNFVDSPNGRVQNSHGTDSNGARSSGSDIMGQSVFVDLVPVDGMEVTVSISQTVGDEDVQRKLDDYQHLCAPVRIREEGEL